MDSFIKSITVAVLLFIAIGGQPCYAQTQLDSAFTSLKSADFGVVYQARKTILTKYQFEVIPGLINLLRDTGYVKLTNTADLIYPGAIQFYGHGWVVGYDIDWISVRAAWLLEELTFQDFGFLNQQLVNENSLTSRQRQAYQSYLIKGYPDISFADTAHRTRIIRYRQAMALKAAEWWKVSAKNWNIYKGLQEALSSRNINREGLAIYYLRFGTTPYTQRDDKAVRRAYTIKLKPLINKIAQRKGGQREQAQYLLKEM